MSRGPKKASKKIVSIRTSLGKRAGRFARVWQTLYLPLEQLGIWGVGQMVFPLHFYRVGKRNAPPHKGFGHVMGLQ